MLDDYVGWTIQADKDYDAITGCSRRRDRHSPVG